MLSWTVMRMFVTGGAGFIGSNYVRWVLSNADSNADCAASLSSAERIFTSPSPVERVVVYDVLTYAGGLDTLNDVLKDDRVVFVHGDVCDRAAVTEAMTGCDSVVHFAAESHVDRSIADSDIFVRTNCCGTNVVCDVAWRLGVGRFVHVSTDEVYGSIDSGSFTECSPLRPRSPYAATKAASDLIALSYYHTRGLNVMVTRSSNNFGSYQFPEKVIPLFVVNLIDGESIPLYGDGTNVRDWCYVDDNCAGIHTVLCLGDAGEVYNIGAGNELSNRDLAQRLTSLCGRDTSAITGVADRAGHDLRYSLDSSKMAALGWSPQQSFDKALVATVEWYRHNRWWWESRKVTEL